MAIYLILAISLINETGLRLANVVLVLYAVNLGADPFAVGFLGATFSLFPILVAVPAGKLGDRFGVRWLIAFGSMIGVMAMLIPYFSPSLAACFVAAALYGVFDGLHLVSIQNLVGILSSPEKRTRNFSTLSLVNSISVSVGPLIAGLSIDHSGHANACLYGAILASVPFFILAIWGRVLPKGTGVVKKAGASTLRMLWDPAVRGVLILGCLFQTGNTLYQIYLPVYSSAVGLSATMIGVVLSMNAAAMFIIRLVLPGLIARFKEKRILVVMFFASAASLFTIPIFKDAWILTLLSFLFGLGMGCGAPLIQVLMFNNAPPGRSGEALGLRMSVNHSAKMVSPIVFGAIASGFGFLPMFWASAIMMCIGGVFSRKR